MQRNEMSSTNINQCLNSSIIYTTLRPTSQSCLISDQMRPATCSTVQYRTAHYSTVDKNPCEDAVLHGRGEAAPLGGVGVQVPAHDVLYPLRGQDQQN